MVDDTIDLDQRRGIAALKAAELRRLRIDVETDRATQRAHQAELETTLASEPAKNWPEAIIKTRYLLDLFAETSAAADPRRRALLRTVLADFEHLLRLEPHDNDGASKDKPPI